MVLLNLSAIIRVPKVPFRVFDQLQTEIQKSIIIFCLFLDMKIKIQITDCYTRVKKGFYLEFLMVSFVFHFIK